MAFRRIIYSKGTGKQNSNLNLLLSDVEALFGGIKDDTLSMTEASGEFILEKTLPYTPMDTGDLRDTGKVETQRTDKGAQTRVSFGGVAPSGRLVDYASIVNFDLSPKHFKEKGTGPLYLNRGAAESIAEIKKIFADGLKASVRKRTK